MVHGGSSCAGCSFSALLIAPRVTRGQSADLDPSLLKGDYQSDGHTSDGSYCPILANVASSSDFAKRARAYQSEGKTRLACLHGKVAHCIEKGSMTFEKGYRSCMSERGDGCKKAVVDPTHPSSYYFNNLAGQYPIGCNKVGK